MPGRSDTSKKSAGASARAAAKNRRTRKAANPKTIRKLKRFMILTAAVLIVSAIVFAVIFSAFRASLKKSIPDKYYGYTLSVGHKNGNVWHSHSVSGKYLRDGCIYVPFTEIAELCGLTVTGDKNELKFISGEEYAKVTLGEKNILINGNCILSGNRVYGNYADVMVPLSFIEDYAKGISVIYDNEKKTVKIDFPTDENGEYESTDFTYSVKKNEKCEGINYDGLPENIKELTFEKSNTDVQEDTVG